MRKWGLVHKTMTFFVEFSVFVPKVGMIFVQKSGPICPDLHSNMSNIVMFCLGNMTWLDPWERCFKNWKQFRYNISTFSSSKQYMMTLLIAWLFNYVQNSLAKIINSINNGYHITRKTRSFKADRIRNKSRESFLCLCKSREN